MPECNACHTPIGADSIALGFTIDDGLEIAYCAPCRRCSSCNMSLAPNDLKFCYNLGMDRPKHMRCMTMADRADLVQSGAKEQDLELSILNYCLTMPQFEDMITSIPTFEAKYHFLQALQAASAQCSIILGRDKRWREEKQRIEAESITTYQKQTKQQAPKKNPIADAKKVGIRTSSEKVARQKLTLRDKAIRGYTAMGLSFDAAAAIVDKMHGNLPTAGETKQ